MLWSDSIVVLIQVILETVSMPVKLQYFVVSLSPPLYRKHNNSELSRQLYIQCGTLVLLHSEWQPQGTMQ